MKKDYLSEILENTYTKNVLNKRVRLLRSYLEKSYFGKSRDTLSAFLKQRGEDATDIKAMSSWGEEYLKQFTKDSLYPTIKEMQKAVEKLPVVTVFLPYGPSEDDIQKFSNWFRANVNKKAILDIRSDPESAGGIRLAWNGVYRDYSFSYYLKKYRDDIRAIVSSYDKHE